MDSTQAPVSPSPPSASSPSLAALLSATSPIVFLNCLKLIAGTPLRGPITATDIRPRSVRVMGDA